MRPPSLLFHLAAATLLFTLLPTPYSLLSTTLALAQTTQERKAEADRLLQQGREQYQANQWKAALQSWEQALALYRELHDRVGEGKTLGNLGIVYNDLGNSNQAIAFLQQSLVVTRASKDQATESRALSNLGAVYRELRDYTKALSYQQQSLVIARQIKNRSIEESTLSSLGDTYFAAESLPKAIEAYQQSVVIARELKDFAHLERAYLNLGCVYENLGDYTKAIDYQQQALTIARDLKDRIIEEKALNNLGNFYEDIDEYAKALEFLQRSLTIAQALHDRKGEGQTLSNLGNVYNDLADYPKAITYHQQALAIAQAIKDRANEFRALNNLGIAYDDLGNYPRAIEYKQQALAIARQMQDRRGMETAFDNLGNTYKNLGDYPQAISYHQQGLTVARELNDRRGEGRSLGNLGNAYRALGDYAKAIDYHQQSLAIARAINNRQSEKNALSNIGVVYYTLGDYAKAIDYGQQSLRLAKTIKDRQGEAHSFGNLGGIYTALGDYPRALYYQQQALAIERAIQDRRAEGESLGNLGVIYQSSGNDAKAVDYLQQSLAVARAIKNRSGEASVLINLGDIYRTLQNYPKAIAAQQQALAIARELKDRQAEGTALNNLGVALEELGKLAEAERTFADAIQVRESLRAGLGNHDGYKVSIFENQARTYRSLQRVLVAQNKPNEALEIAEHGRARALVELLVQNLVADFRANEPGKSRSPSVSSVPPSVAQMQQTAKARNAVLVEYSIIYDTLKLEGKEQVKDSALYIWVIQPNGQITFRSVDLKPLWQQQKTSLAELVENSRKGIGVSDRGDRADVEVVLTPAYLQQLREQQSRYLHQLHHLLIEPIADLLPTDPMAHVIFMPQESLFLVPFAALMDKSDHYLIQQHTISIAPAIQVLGLTHQQQKAVRSQESGVRSVLVAGNPIMPKVTVPGADVPLYLPDLPGAKQEAIAVAKTLHTIALTGKQATKHAIVQQMQTARIIHLATHGLLDDFKGLGVPGAIALAPDGNGQPNDGLLTSDDILGMKLNAELVVLSACNTGRGKLTGDGVIGLSRSLIAAGVPSIMVSLWSVPDAPTAALMTDFYTTLQHTPDKAQALRQAMLDTLKDHPEPRDWAAFTLIGEAQ